MVLIQTFLKKETIDLQYIGGQVFQKSQGRITLSKIINGAGEVGALEPLDSLQEQGRVVKDRGLRELNFRKLGRNGIFVTDAYIFVNKMLAIRLKPRYVRRYRKCLYS